MEKARSGFIEKNREEGGVFHEGKNRIKKTSLESIHWYFLAW